MSEALRLDGWTHTYSGKVRDLYVPAAPHPAGDVVLMVASDRISAFDYVLPTPIPDKGWVLTQLSLWWAEQLADIVPSHLVSTDVPAQVAGRAIICRRLQMYPIECVARGYLTGSALAEYRATGSACGYDLPAGLPASAALPRPLFTPATKAELGDHDENITFAQAQAVVGPDAATRLRDVTLAIYARAAGIAREAGIILADTKLEFGLADGVLTVGDEVLTPDCSRFWDAATWAEGVESPASYDKQYVRDYLAATWTDRSTPPPALPQDVVERTRARYFEALERLTGRRAAHADRL